MLDFQEYLSRWIFEVSIMFWFQVMYQWWALITHSNCWLPNREQLKENKKNNKTESTKRQTSSGSVKELNASVLPRPPRNSFASHDNHNMLRKYRTLQITCQFVIYSTIVNYAPENGTEHQIHWKIKWIILTRILWVMVGPKMQICRLQ